MFAPTIISIYQLILTDAIMLYLFRKFKIIFVRKMKNCDKTKRKI